MENSIHWLVQEIADYPRIAEGVAPQGLLSEQESAKLATLHVDKRRRDWLLGRLTAKQLLQVFLQDEMGQSLPLDQIVIDNDSEGAPFASMNEERLACSLSISHSNGAALCAVHPSVTVGADMERIETRDWSFVRSYFTPSEIVQVEDALPEQRDLLSTAIWSGKEAVLKVLREGLRLDTRLIECRFDPVKASTTDWIPFGISWQMAVPDADPIRWSGWWRLYHKAHPFVLTLATKEKEVQKVFLS